MAHSDRSTHDPQPPMVGAISAVALSLLIVPLVGGDLFGLLGAVLGTACVIVGLRYATQGAVTLGSAFLLGAVLIVGIERDPLWLLLSTVIVVLVWAVAGHAIRLGSQVGRTGETRRVELVHSISILVVGGVGGGVGYVGYRSVTGSQSPLALAFLLGSVVAAVVVLQQ